MGLKLYNKPKDESKELQTDGLIVLGLLLAVFVTLAAITNLHSGTPLN